MNLTVLSFDTLKQIGLQLQYFLVNYTMLIRKERVIGSVITPNTLIFVGWLVGRLVGRPVTIS